MLERKLKIVQNIIAKKNESHLIANDKKFCEFLKEKMLNLEIVLTNYEARE